MGGYHEDGFEDFRKQAILMFPDLDSSQIQINVNARTTLAADLTPEDMETDEELVVTNEPDTVADDPVNPFVS